MFTTGNKFEDYMRAKAWGDFFANLARQDSNAEKRFQRESRNHKESYNRNASKRPFRKSCYTR